MSILLMFNSTLSITFQQLLQATQVSELDIKCNLVPLFQLKLLTKSNPSPTANLKEFNLSDVYTLN